MSAEARGGDITMPTSIMPNGMPSSTVRHRPIHPSTDEAAFVTPRASRTQNISERRTTGEATLVKINAQPSKVNTQKNRHHSLHWSISIGISMVAMLILLWLGQTLWAWGTVTYDDIKYGRPRTMQTDAFVGHETANVPSHFIALNEHGRIEIIELPGGDASHARIFLGPQLWGNGADLAPIILTFIPTAPHSKLLDMKVSFQGSQVLFHNTKGTFVLSSPDTSQQS
jgi:hypothetical protein